MKFQVIHPTSKSGQAKSGGKIQSGNYSQGFYVIPDMEYMLSYLQFYHIPFLVPKTPAPSNNKGPILFPELVDFSNNHLLSLQQKM